MTTPDATTDAAGEGPLTIEFPAQRGYLRVCRLTVAALASGVGLDVDELDDLRLAVTEAVTWLVEGGRESDRAALSVVLDNGITVEGTCRCEDPPDGSGDDLLHAILGATLDEFDLRSDQRRTFRLVKRPMGV